MWGIRRLGISQFCHKEMDWFFFFRQTYKSMSKSKWVLSSPLGSPPGILHSGEDAAFTLNIFTLPSWFSSEWCPSCLMGSPLGANLISENHFASKIMWANNGKILIYLRGFERMHSKINSMWGPEIKGAEAAASVLSTVTTRDPTCRSSAGRSCARELDTPGQVGSWHCMPTCSIPFWPSVSPFKSWDRNNTYLMWLLGLYIFFFNLVIYFFQ